MTENELNTTTTQIEAAQEYWLICEYYDARPHDSRSILGCTENYRESLVAFSKMLLTCRHNTIPKND
jgi:hypothetical protein